MNKKNNKLKKGKGKTRSVCKCLTIGWWAPEKCSVNIIIIIIAKINNNNIVINVIITTLMKANWMVIMGVEEGNRSKSTKTNLQLHVAS